MSVKVINPNAGLVVPLATLKAHCYVVGTQDDALITEYAASATDLAQNFTGRFFLQTVAEYRMDGFPNANSFYIPRPPLISVDKIEYYDVDGVLQEFDLNKLYIVKEERIGRVVLKSGESWEKTESGRPNSVIVTFKSGYGNTSTDVPSDIRNAIRLMVASSFENRQEDYVIQGVGIKSLSEGAKYILWSYRVFKDFENAS